MKKTIAFSIAGLLGLMVLTLPVAAQQSPATGWSPPSREMPQMPSSAELQSDWRGLLGSWFAGVESVSGVAPAGLRASGEPKSGADRTQLVRFTSGPLPISVWTDRNADGRADLIEIFRSGRVLVQLIDADYNGQADVIRTYDDNGTLLGERKL